MNVTRVPTGALSDRFIKVSNENVNIILIYIAVTVKITKGWPLSLLWSYCAGFALADAASSTRVRRQPT